ncbi:MAG: hypothetical protein AAFQ64_13400 [Pseudomonadota bacterium]
MRSISVFLLFIVGGLVGVVWAVVLLDALVPAFEAAAFKGALATAGGLATLALILAAVMWRRGA